MASRKGGVYDLLDFVPSEDPRAQSEGTREEEMYQRAAAIVEDDWDEGVTMRRDALSQSAEFQREVEKEITHVIHTHEGIEAFLTGYIDVWEPRTIKDHKSSGDSRYMLSIKMYK